MSELKPFDEFMDALVHCDTVKVILTGCGESTFETKPIYEGICALANHRIQPANEPLTTIDAVEVVRCRDCVHFGECLVTENDYCSKGERKEK